MRYEICFPDLGFVLAGGLLEATLHQLKSPSWKLQPIRAHNVLVHHEAQVELDLALKGGKVPIAAIPKEALARNDVWKG